MWRIVLIFLVTCVFFTRLSASAYLNPIQLLTVWDTITLDENIDSLHISIQQKLNALVPSVLVYWPKDSSFLSKNNPVAIDSETITPYTHKWIIFEMVDRNNAFVGSIHLLRSNKWLLENNLKEIGHYLFFDDAELGLNGWARVERIVPCQLDMRYWLEDRIGDYVRMPVVGKFVHQGSVTSYVFGDSIVVNATPAHKFWNVDRADWVSITDWSKGERAKGQGDNLFSLKGVSPQGEAPVYNLQVLNVHNFSVTKQSILVHNNNYESIAKEKLVLVANERQKIFANLTGAMNSLKKKISAFYDDPREWTDGISINNSEIAAFERQYTTAMKHLDDLENNILPYVKDDLQYEKMGKEVEMHRYTFGLYKKWLYEDGLESTFMQMIKYNPRSNNSTYGY